MRIESIRKSLSNVMINHIILDVDGVLVGNKKGFNFPKPNLKVQQKLFNLQNEGKSVTLCTGKGWYSLEKILSDIGLEGNHVADGGGIVGKLEMTSDTLIVNTIGKKEINELYEESLKNSLFLELHTLDGFSVDKSANKTYVKTHESILETKATILESIRDIGDNVVKAVLIYMLDEKNKVKNIQKSLSNLTFSFSSHPLFEEIEIAIITRNDISKETGIKSVAEIDSIDFSEALAVGDNISDWQFMHLCKYVATLENGKEALKEKINKKHNSEGFIGPHVNDNGILKILKYFNI